MSNITFKAQDKSNAKRFLVKTCKLENFEDYLTQHDGKWGTWIDAEGRPVLAATAAAPAAAEAPAAAPAQAATVETEPAADEVAPGPSADAFGAFALSQLAGSGAAVPTGAPSPRPANSTGLKIQKDRPEVNGVRRQSAGSVGDRLWAIYDAAGPDITLEQAKAAAVAAGLSATSAAIALYNWRKYNGIPAKVGKKA